MATLPYLPHILQIGEYMLYRFHALQAGLPPPAEFPRKWPFDLHYFCNHAVDVMAEAASNKGRNVNLYTENTVTESEYSCL